MKQPIDVLAVFEQGESVPRPIRFKLFENGIKKTVDVHEILKHEHLGAGGMSRIEYTCRSRGHAGRIEYRLNYYYNVAKWDIETKEGPPK